MKKILSFMLVALVTLAACTTTTPKKEGIVVSGSVQFPDDKFAIEVFYRDGADKIVVDTIKLNPDHTFSQTLNLPHPGVYSIDCMKWETINFWGEDEDIAIQFRGQDTAKVKIKNPPFHLIENAGPNNELMNLINFSNYMSYQGMIAAGQEVYKAGQSKNEAWQEFAIDGYMKNSDRAAQYTNYLAEAYAHRNSIVALLPSVRNKEVKEKLLAKLEQTMPNYEPYVKWKQAEEEKQQKLNQLKVGSVAPTFSYATPDGTQNLGPQDFKGKYLVMDFWASWCGPCRNLIPHLKEVYETYNAQGLEILSISIDKDEDKWRKAMTEEEMPWSQVLAPLAGKEVLKLYQFNGIPHVVLLDKEGKIMGRGLTADELDKQLENIFQ